MKTLSVTTEVFFKKAIGVAEYYGFSNIDKLKKKASQKGISILELKKSKAANVKFEQNVLAEMFKHCSDTISLKKNRPVMFYTPSLASHPSSPSEQINALTLNAVGTNDPIAEVVLLKSAMSILEELNIKKYTLKINSIGDNDSSTRFLKEASIKIKQNTDKLPRRLAEKINDDLGGVLAHLHNMNHPFSKQIPSPIEFLTTPSRKYFKEVLELLNNAEISFELSEKLYADPKVYSHTIFEIVEENDSEEEDGDNILARGGRYDELTRAYTKGSVPSTGIVIALKTKNRASKLSGMRRRKANACLVHIGQDARIRTIELLETFRKRKIPIEQCLYFDRFSEQMQKAQSLNTKYIIIIGQKEAQEGVALIRNTKNHSQQTVPFDMLPDMIK
jgi:histidyl-tRNA synthetase